MRGVSGGEKGVPIAFAGLRRGGNREDVNTQDSSIINS